MIYNFILTISQVAFPIVSIPYISRVLDPAGLGRVSFMDSFAYYFVVIAEAGIITYGVREVARRRGDPVALRKTVSELLSLHIRTSIISISLFVLFVSFVYHRIGDSRLIWLSLSFLIANAFSCEWYFWGKESFGYIALRSLIIRLLGLVSIFVLVNQPADYHIYYMIIVLSAIATVAWNIVVLIKEIKPSLRFTNWRSHLRGVAIMYGISLSYSVMIMLDSVFLGLAVSAAAVSFYALAIKIVRMATSIITDPLLVLYPNMVARLSGNDNEGYRRISNLAFQGVIITTIPFGVGIYMISDLFTDVYLGSDFISVSECLKILSFYPLLNAIALFLNKQVLMPRDGERLVLKGLVFSMLLFIPLALTLSFHYSFYGTCVAIMITTLFNAGINAHYAKQMDPDIKLFSLSNTIHSILGSIFFIPIINFLAERISNRIVCLVVSVVICMIVYFIWMLVVRNRTMFALLAGFKFPGFKSKYESV